MSWLNGFSRRFIFVVLCSMPFVFVSLLWWKYPTWIVHEWIFDELLTGKVFAPSLGEFGDVYGALNTLFSGLAFSGVIVSIVLQSAELRATRKEMNAQVQQFEQQTKTMHRQTFENTFYNLIKMIDSNLSRFSVKENRANGSTHIISGGDAIAHYLTEGLKVLFFTNKEEDETLLDDIYSVSYEDFDTLCGENVRPYVMSVYYTLMLIDDMDSAYKDKKFYSNILRSRISNDELRLLFFVCISVHGNDKLKSLMEKYAFFEHLDGNLIEMFASYVEATHFISKFDINAFGKTNDLYLRTLRT